MRTSWTRSTVVPKYARIDAYARLGELATPESLRAQKRVAALLRGRPLTRTGVSIVSRPHPSVHRGDSPDPPVGLLETRLGNGERLVIFPDDFLGQPELFLMRCEPDRLRLVRPSSARRVMELQLRQDRGFVEAAWWSTFSTQNRASQRARPVREVPRTIAAYSARRDA